MDKRKMHTPNLTQDNMARIRELYPNCVTEAEGKDGKLKMIYIDPPYNTGNDFIYEDDFAENTDEFLRRSNQKDEEGNRLVANTESNGRFHSDWLSMMYPRLKLARNLLREDGVIFISIDDNEIENLKKICNGIFGEDNFIATIIWRKKASPDARSTIGCVHDYILCYLKTSVDPKKSIGKMALSENHRQSFSNPDNDPRGSWASVDMTGMTGRATKDQFFQLETPGGRVLGPPDGRSWGPIEKNYLALKEDNRIWFGLSGNNVPRVKQFLSESEGQTVPTYWGYDDVASKESLQGKTVFFVDENALVACFDTDLTEDLVKELAHFKPLRVVFRDTGFASDAVKINATQIFRQMSPGTEVKAI